MTTALTIVTDAMLELNIIAAEQSPSASDADFCLRHLNRMISGWTGEGMRLVYPSGVTTWRGDWASATTYAVNDGVSVNGRVYKCLVAHTSTDDDKPIVGLNQATYWSQTLPTDLALADDIDLDASDEGALVWCLAERIAGPYGVELTDIQARNAYEGRLHISARYMPVADPAFDPGLVYTPSRRWPYTTTSG